jgi:hypothetical protein
MNVYMLVPYRPSLVCEPCGKRTLDWESKSEYTHDSDIFLKGPYPNGGGESDAPEHCDDCGVFLENSLTDEGRDYVQFYQGAIPEEWRQFYHWLWTPTPHNRSEAARNYERDFLWD